MKDLGAATKNLGMEILKDTKAGKLLLTQKNYVEKILQRFNMKEAKPKSTPIASHFKLLAAPSSHTDQEKRSMEEVPYSSAKHSLMYAMVYA